MTRVDERVRVRPDRPTRHRRRKRFRPIDYPRRGKHGVRRWLPSWKLVLGSFLFFVAGVVGAFFLALALVKIPQPNEFAMAQATIFEYADGVQFAHVGTNRVSVPFGQIPQDLRDAILAAEDRSFYQEPGVSPTGMVRALRNDLFGNGDLQGGSTITQQYVKNYYLTEQQSLNRKFTEILISIKLDEQESKDEILQNYLNTVFFARNSYGVEAASMAYFGEHVGALADDPAKAAYLAAVTNSPYYFGQADSDPAAAAALRDRWNYVLDGMVSMHSITQAQRQALVFPGPVPRRNNDLAGANGYLVNAAVQYLDQQHDQDPDAPSAAAIYRGGYTIVTTYTQASMARAQQAATTDLATLNPQANPADAGVHLGVAAVDLRTGAVTGFYGGPDYTKQGFNDALQAGGPIGKSIGTPIVQSFGPLGKQYWPQVVAGLGQVGIKDQNPAANPPGDDDLSGTALQVAAAYVMIANKGIYHRPFEVSEVTRGGQPIWQAQPAPARYNDGGPIQPFVTAGSDGADQWAWTVGRAGNEEVAVSMYATKPNSAATRALTGMTPLRRVVALSFSVNPVVLRTNTVFFDYLKGGD